MKDITVFTALLIISILLPGKPVVAGPAGSSDLTPDDSGYQLEMSGHEKLSALKNAPQSRLSDFNSDGCSGGLSVGWEYLAGKLEKFERIHGAQPPWEGCCISHDRAYHAAGGRNISAAESYGLRKTTDQLLRTCVQRTGAEEAPELGGVYGISAGEVELLYDIIAGLMYRAVRIGGLPCTGLPWRWGYGWPECD